MVTSSAIPINYCVHGRRKVHALHMPIAISRVTSTSSRVYHTVIDAELYANNQPKCHCIISTTYSRACVRRIGKVCTKYGRYPKAGGLCPGASTTLFKLGLVVFGFWLCVHKYVYLCIVAVCLWELGEFHILSVCYLLVYIGSSPAENMHLGAGHDTTMRSCVRISWGLAYMCILHRLFRCV